MHRRYLSSTISRCAELPPSFNITRNVVPPRKSHPCPWKKKEEKEDYDPFKLSSHRFRDVNPSPSERIPARDREMDFNTTRTVVPSIKSHQRPRKIKEEKEDYDPFDLSSISNHPFRDVNPPPSERIPAREREMDFNTTRTVVPSIKPHQRPRKIKEDYDSFKLSPISNHPFRDVNPLPSERIPARERETELSKKSLRTANTMPYQLLRDVVFSETIIEGGKGGRALKVLVERHQARAMMLNEEKTSDIADLGLSDELYQGVSFAPGTFIEARRNEIAVQGFVLSEVIIDRQWHVYTLKSNGEVYIHLRADIHFAIPNLISANLAERCGTEPITYSQSELNARVEALRQLREITLAAEHAANGSSIVERQKNIDIYNIVRSREPHRWNKTSVSEVAKMLYKNPTFLEFLGTHKFLMNNSLKYVAARDYIKSQTFSVRPIEDVEEIETVIRWIRIFRESGHTSGPHISFIKKARSLIKKYDNDKSRRDSGPMTRNPAKHTWTSSDQVILGFLLRSLQPHRSTQTNPYALGRSTILKHLYPGQEVSDSMTHETLIKLGVLAPWQDLLALLPEFDIDLEPEATSPRAIAEKALVERSYSTAGSMAGQVLGPEDFLPTDPLESVRHDFGNDRVFIIDDFNAEELDDGFSLERIPSEPDNHWIHVHIADPAHLLHPGHALCHQARKRGSTLYFLQKSYPLFPKALMHHPTRGLSLGSDARNGLPNKVITFSIKVDGNANILDYTVRAGLIRNIKKTTYSCVDQALGVPPPDIVYPFGPPPKTPAPSLAPPMSEQDLKDLRIFYRLANDQVQKRFREDRISFTMESAKLSRMSPFPDIRSPTMEPTVFNGFPELLYSVGGAGVEDIGSRSLVSEMMKLACRVASRFALDHNLPFLRRGTDAIMASSPAAYEEILAQRSPYSYVPLHTNLERIAISPPAAFSLEPKQHHPLSVPEGEGYCRATSPLRRFDDLVEHWQLHHALLGSKAPLRPPFDTDDLEKYIPELSAKDISIRNGHTRNINAFVLMFLKRWMNDTAKGVERPFGDPLASMTAYTISMVQDTTTGSHGCHLHLPEIGTKAHLEGLSPGSTFPLSTELKVKVKYIDLGIQRPKLVVELV